MADVRDSSITAFPVLHSRRVIFNHFKNSLLDVREIYACLKRGEFYVA